MTTTRFAPSPTGHIHVGNLRAALFNFLIARKTGGTFILRFDDTDRERSKQEYMDGIKRDLEWLGIGWDRIEQQSKRLDRYEEMREKLREDGRIYEVFETPGELDLKRKKQLNMGKPPVYDRAGLALSDAEKEKLRSEGRQGYWRFKLAHERIEWNDRILGDISIDASSVSDPVLIRADGQVLYTFASSVDDTDMGVTDIVRGSDHVTNTATQIQIIEALGGNVPNFAHHSLLTGPQGEELSKRLGSLAIRDLREAGIAPEALVSMMSRLGSSQPVELLTMDEVTESFDLAHFGASPTKFDSEDLWPLTRARNQSLPFEAVKDRIAALGVPADQAERFWRVASQNITKLDDLAGWWTIFSEGAEPDIAEEDRDFIAEAMTMLPPPPYDDSSWAEFTAKVKDATGRKGKGLFMPLRKALTGQAHGPDMGDLMPLLQVVKARG
ncbi:glutamate--tRNA ligase [Paracoccus aerodenitrificans]|uniref:glutamate--tRNA ligase n=1 Tax=Paracoccus aerodenitrificans TaxID=3017781 RepID=UPI0022F04D4A|nr:glutamate--tRNA ligase [Paracoccus aerodenitrificans]WBU64452.1 glutamate--tRNA ligase [Paracoccus aerodenitrificans]